MKKLLKVLSKEIWVILLDILAVNGAYLITLMVRLGDNSGFFTESFHDYYASFLRFAPFNTIIAIAVFALFRLYGGLWQYSGIHDLNRIVGASLVASLLHILGITFFVRRMPMTYYLIGSAIQLILIVIIRFAQRALFEEKRLFSSHDQLSVPTMIIGAGELCRKKITELEDSPFRPTVILDKKYAGKALDGIPIVEGELGETISVKSVREVMIADLSLSQEEKSRIREICEQYGIGCQDVTEAYGGDINISLNYLLRISEGPVVLVIGGEEKTFSSGEEALINIKDWYDIVNAVDVKLTLKRHSSVIPQTPSADFEKEYREKNGHDLSFF